MRSKQKSNNLQFDVQQTFIVKVLFLVLAAFCYLNTLLLIQSSGHEKLRKTHLYL